MYAGHARMAYANEAMIANHDQWKRFGIFYCL